MEADARARRGYTIAILAIGTRGDAQPALALGKALAARGHRVRMLVGANFTRWVEGHGLEAAASKLDMQAIMEGESGRDWVEKGNSPFAQMRALQRLIDETGWDMLSDTYEACRGAQVVISSFTSYIEAASIADKLGLSHICALLQPAMVATRSGSAVFHAPFPHRESVFNHLFSKAFIEPSNWRLRGAIVNRFRKEVLGLAPQSAGAWREAMQRLPVVLGYSRHVVPHPPDWPDTIHTTGYWFLDEGGGWSPPGELIGFLDAGEAPVVIGFGSMTGKDPRAFTRLIVEAVRQSGRRAILLSGWGGVDGVDLPASVLRLDAAPHDWLFPRVAAVVHHGGAGTTAAGLRAGVPLVVVPHMGDQPFWGQRVEALGVGPKAIPRHKLTASALAEAMRRAASDASMRARASALGAKIRAEDGLTEAIMHIERVVEAGNRAG